MKRSAMIVICMLLLPGLSLAAEQAGFEGGLDEVVVALNAPSFEATVNLEVPAGCYVTNATMNVTGMAAENNATAYPENVTLRLNETLLWEFQHTGFGPMGKQDRFSTGMKQVTSSFGAKGGAKTQYVRLPKDALVQSATMQVRGAPPEKEYLLMNDTGDNESYSLGSRVADAGDVNGDGYDDVITNYGILYYGGPSMDDVKDVIFTEAVNMFGRSLSGAGDVNGDGYDDIIIGADQYGSGGSFVGRAYLYFGSPNMDNVADVIMTGMSSGVRFGASVSNAGDVNGDGFDDIIVGAPGRGVIPDYLGEAYIFFGGQNMDNTSDITLTVNTTHFKFGSVCSDAGDVNGDGYDDVIVASYFDSNHTNLSAYVFLGGQNMDDRPDMIFPNSGCTGVGDVNNDGYDDLINSPKDEQKINLFYGNSTMDITADLCFTVTRFMATGVGDVNQDGWDDMAIWEYGDALYIYLGSDQMDNQSDIIFSELTEGLDAPVSAAGDVNGDGYDDIIVGVPFNDSGGNNAGAIYIYTCHLSNATGILNPGIAIGSKSIWKDMGYFNETAEPGDFTGALNTYLESGGISGKDLYGNSYVDIPVELNAAAEGIMTLLNLTIIYQYKARVPDFSSALGDYLVSHQYQKDADGNIKVPIKIYSLSAGRVKLSGIDLAPDLPPILVKEIGSVELPEDGWNSTLVDLYPYFDDDVDIDTRLVFSVVSSTNSTFVTIGIKSKRYLAADASTGEANDNWTGTIEVVVACADHWGQKTESNKFVITVVNVNDEPIISSSPAYYAEAGVIYYYNVTAIDGDNDTLKFSLPKAPTGMTIDAATGKIRWLPRAGGNHNVTVNVSDGIASAEQRFSIFVANKAPRITSQPVLNGTTGIAYIYNVTAEDDNLDALKFSLTSSIIGMTIDSLNGTITWTPIYVNNYDVVVVVSDGIASATQEFTIRVVQGNRAPKFISVPVKNATVGLPYEYQARGMDEDEDVLGFSIIVGPVGMTVDGASGKVSWTPVAAGNFTLKLKVMDGKGGDAVQEFTINVADKVGAKVSIDKPAENEKVKGKTTISGTAVKGTLEVTGVQVRIDGGDWADTSGNYSWQYVLDTATLKNGKHKLEARAFDGKDYSDIVERQFTVDNQKAQGKGFIPMIDGWMLLALLCALGAAAPFVRKSTRGRG